MEIFRIKLINPDTEFKDEWIYFMEQRTAEAYINALNSMAKKGKNLNWECEELHAYTHKEARNELCNM